MCSAQLCWRPNTDGTRRRPRSCWKMKIRIRFPLPTNFSRGVNGRSTSKGCKIGENSSLPSAAVASTNRAKICARLEELGHFRDITEQQIFSGGSLNAFMAMGRPAWKKTRAILQNLLSADNGALRDNSELREHAFHKQSEVTMQLPARVGDYTDFYSSYHHAHNVGTMLRGPENALMPNWKWLPVAYHGRASSIVVSGTEVKRPHGQTKPADASATVF